MGILATNTTFFHSVFKPLVRGVLGQGTEELTASLASGGEALMVFFYSVCRALGIPSRVVSNLVSAHDANSSLTVDKYYTETMEELDYDPNNPVGADSIWNYHVWNDVWMARPDLPPGMLIRRFQTFCTWRLQNIVILILFV